jgi:hypothetical protein
MGYFLSAAAIGGVGGGFIGGVIFATSNLTVVEEMAIFSSFMIILLLICYPYLYTLEEEQTVTKTYDENQLTNQPQQQLEHQQEQNTIEDEENISEEKEQSPKASEVVIESRDWLGICMLSFIAGISFFVEGSVGDWGGIYLEDHWHASPLLSITGYIAERLTMLFACLICDTLCTYYIHRLYLLLIGCLLTIIGFIMTVIAYDLPVGPGSLTMVILGFCLVGIGCGWIYPIWYSLAGRGIRGFTVAETCTYVTTFAMLLYFVDPLILGNISDAFGSLQYSFGFNVILTFLAIPCALCIPAEYFEISPSSSLSREKSINKDMILIPMTDLTTEDYVSDNNSINNDNDNTNIDDNQQHQQHQEK